MSYMGNAWLLSQSGDVIPVENHPSIKNEFDKEDIIKIVEEYGSDSDIQKLTAAKDNAEKYWNLAKTIYYETWCKVRVWGTLSNEVTFRITSTEFNWYSIILQFCLDHPEFKNSKITVCTDKLNGSKRTYLDQVPYEYLIDPTNETILASSFIGDDRKSI